MSVMVPAMTATTELIRMSLLRTWPNSCASTPYSSSSSRITSRTGRATMRKAVFSWFILRLYAGGGAVNRLPRLRFGLVLGEAADPRLVGDAQLIHRVVVGVGDVVAALRIERRHVEVEQVSVGTCATDTRDAQIANVPDVHRRAGDLGHSPCRARRSRRSSLQVERLRGIKVPGIRSYAIRDCLTASAAPR